ncbi:MAG: I78 family peptidase inhibitor [Alphaproteobacteria bacterium]
MRKLHILTLTILLAGCAEFAPTPNNTTNTSAPVATTGNQSITTSSLDEPAKPQDGTCPSNEYASLIGQKFQDIPSEQLPPYFRTLKPGQNLVMSQPLRVNLYLDRLGKVTAVRCG